MSRQACAFALIASCKAVTAGIRRCFAFTAAAIYMADGNESFDDWAMLT
jgi:protein gp37